VCRPANPEGPSRRPLQADGVRAVLVHAKSFTGGSRMTNVHIFCLLSATTVFTLSEPADAIGVGGFAGQCVGYCSCIDENYGTADYDQDQSFEDAGICGPGVGQTWEVPLPVNSGSYTPTIGVGWPSGHQMSDYISCAVVSMQQLHSGSAYQSTGYIYASSTAGSYALQPGTVSVPSNGFMFASCFMSYHSQVYSVNY
jgi:hypothetical protein